MLKEKIEAELKDAMKEKAELKVSVLRMFLSSLRNKAIEKRAKGMEMTEDDMVAIMRSEVKKRKDSIQEFNKGGRKDLVDKEEAELKLLENYLPAEMSDEDLEKIVKKVLETIGPVTIKDFGRVIGQVMKETKGQASGDRVSSTVKKFLQPV
ncbi:MAG: GatB/YqeY domain-containing protein [bacterium]|nr:GatB/YqeY domain-containing protein [bacterium]